MLGVITAIVFTAAATQNAMVKPEPERLAAEEIRAPLVARSHDTTGGSAKLPASSNSYADRKVGTNAR